MSDLVLKHVSKVYPGDQWAVRDFSLEIKDKEFLVLVGQDGCGKSTLLRMIAGLEEITSGTLYMDGVDVTNADTRSRNVAMIFKNSVLYPEMTVADNLSFALKLAKLPEEEIEERIVDVASLLDLGKLLGKKTEELRPNDYYRVLLGRALMKRPEVLLLDSTLAELDEKMQEVMREEFARIHDKLQLTAIYVTDNQKTAFTLGKRMVVMNKGEICQEGVPEELLKKPKNSYVAGVVGDPQMNFFQSLVLEEDGQVCLDFKKGKVYLSGEKGNKLLAGGFMKKDVIVGVRANDMKILEKKTGKGNPAVKILAADRNSEYNIIRFSLGETDAVCMMEQPCPCAEGEMAVLAIDAEKLMVFDQETKSTIIY